MADKPRVTRTRPQIGGLKNWELIYGDEVLSISSSFEHHDRINVALAYAWLRERNLGPEDAMAVVNQIIVDESSRFWNGFFGTPPRDSWKAKPLHTQQIARQA